ncbi:polyhydroxyalkanoate synthesis regulator phasin [Paenibacillus anaericanus]|uniref:Spo0B domain-containing protein n=1 Tax=Paenibacillus anaericanus TaxID=170367 RepID=UPI002788339D|nr:Spo0B domain-containing protein [Paenibacillus anaericanus]MDQ0090870.1 polyhydroxyalkanoate synthesis regulator phasin [Paenibacillus anaericanus]
MKHRFTVPVIVLIISLVIMGIIYFVQSPLGDLILCISMLAVLWGYVRYIQRQAAKERTTLLESVQRTAISTLSHHRHDWMNDLQILYGYIQLGKIDKLTNCVERIKERMAVESKISGLGMPSLVFYLQSFREMNGSVQLEVDIEDDMNLSNLLSKDDARKLAEAIIETVRAFQLTGRSSWDEILQLKMAIYRENDEVLVRFDREAGAGNLETLKQHIDELMSGKRVTAEQVDPKLSSLRLRMPCGNINEVNECL